MPDSFLAFDEANSYLDKQQRSLNYFNRIKILSVVDKTSIDLKNTKGYNRAKYINKIKHLDKLPTTTVTMTKLSLANNVSKPLSADDFKELANSLDTDDTMQVSVASQDGILVVEEPQGFLTGIVNQWRNQSSIINGACSVPVVSGNDAKFANMSINESKVQDEDLYEQVKKATNDPEYEKQLDNRIEEAYVNKMHYGDKEKLVDYGMTMGLLTIKEAREINSMLNAVHEGKPVILPNTVDGLNKLLVDVNLYKDAMTGSAYSDRDSVDELTKRISQINEQTRAAQHDIDVIRSIFHTNTASFVSTTTTNTTTTIPERGR